MATRENLAFTLGETWEIYLDCKDVDSAALDLTGGFVQFRLASGGALFLDLHTEVIIVNAVAGSALIVITRDMQLAAEMAAGLYFYEARAVLGNGVVSDQAYGSLNARQSLFEQFP